MEIPYDLRRAIEDHTMGVSRAGLARDAEDISRRCRAGGGTGERLVTLPGEALAYAAARMPATYGAVLSSLGYSLDCLGFRPDSPGRPPDAPALPPKTLLDAGAGTGAAAWAAALLLELREITCLEREAAMRGLGASLMSGTELANTKWLGGDIIKDPLPGSADLVIASYVLGELTEAGREAVVAKLWEAAGMLLLIVEPGTPAGFRVIKKARGLLTGLGANIVAPCPHESACPLGEDDPYGCHFACRLPRSRLHREVKRGDAPYEDEKYAYLAVSRRPSPRAGARVIRHPHIEKGRITLELCTGGGLGRLTVRKNDPRYKQAAKVSWGDAFIL